MLAFEEFRYWFVITKLHRYEVFNKSGKYVGAYSSNRFTPLSEFVNVVDAAEVDADFKKFKARPEYLVGKHFDDTEGKSGYVDRICGAKSAQAYMSNRSNPDDTVRLYREQLKWLDNTDFYVAPASTRYHNCVEGGLFAHTREVYNCALKLCECDIFSGESPSSLTIASLIHDWCKIGLYEKYEANVFDTDLQQWVTRERYRHKDSDHPFGHGETSMYLGARVLNIREEEALAVRWHMGKWYTPDAYNNDLEFANRTYPLVLLIQFADALSITDY